MLRKTMTSPVLDYLATLSRNRHIFLIEHGALLKVFDHIVANFDPIFDLLSTRKDDRGKFQVSLIPFIALLQRQSTVAFEAFASFQSYQGWVIMRPSIEAVLMIGKFVDDRRYVDIWKERSTNRKSYRNAFSGDNLRSDSLPASDRIQSVLAKLNDDFVHVNPEYYSRHVELVEQDINEVTEQEEKDTDLFLLKVHYFDADSDYMANMLAFLHLVLTIQDSLSGLLSALYKGPVSLPYTAAGFRGAFNTEIAAAISTAKKGGEIIQRLGLIDRVVAG